MEIHEASGGPCPVHHGVVSRAGKRRGSTPRAVPDPQENEEARTTSSAAIWADWAGPAIPLDSMAPVPPQVSYQNAQLTIVAPNSTLGDILRAVTKQTGAEIEIPSAPERVVTHLGPGPAREVMAELLNGSRFNYVLLGSPANDAVLTRVVLVAKTGPDNVAAPPSGPSLAEQQQPGLFKRIKGNRSPKWEPDANDADATEENTDDNAGPGGRRGGTATGATPDQPAVKTPQQMLQEMQQRQMHAAAAATAGPTARSRPGVPPQPPQEQQ